MQTESAPNNAIQPKSSGILGILGGIASGKSTAAKILEEFGAVVIDADGLGHAVLAEPEVRERLVSRWGNGVLTSEGVVDRGAVAGRVFGDDRGNELAFLERLTHPRIGDLLQRELARHTSDWVVIDAALLVRAGWHEQCDVLIFVDCPWPLRLARAEARGWTEQQLRDREAAQTTLNLKRDHAHFRLVNDGTREQFAAQLGAIWRQIVKT